MIETKTAVGSFSGILTGLITWTLVAYVPAFRTGIPAPVAALIPVAVAWLAHSVTSYAAPHTHRPDLPPPGLKPAHYATGGNVTMTPPATDRPTPDLTPPARLTPGTGP